MAAQPLVAGQLKINGNVECLNGIYKIEEKICFDFKIMRYDGAKWQKFPNADCLVELIGDQTIATLPHKPVLGENLNEVRGDSLIFCTNSLTCCFRAAAIRVMN